MQAMNAVICIKNNFMSLIYKKIRKNKEKTRKVQKRKRTGKEDDEVFRRLIFSTDDS